jgi:hypothetical protein
MKKILFSMAGVALFAALLVSSCKKSGDEPADINQQTASRSVGINAATVSNLAAFFNTRGPQQQVFDVSSDVARTIQLKSGTTIGIPAGAFTVKGVPITGAIRVSVMETRRRDDLAMAGLNTMNDAGILTSDGSFNFVATASNGQVADRTLAAGKSLRFRVPAGTVAATNLFEGVVQNAANANAPFNWVRPAGVAQDVRAVNNTFDFNWPFTGWVNCDRLASGPGPFTTLTVNIPGNPGPLATFRGNSGDGTFILFAPKTLNSLVHIYTHTTNLQVTSYVNSMPIGMTGKLIGYSTVGGNWWYYEKEITITAAMVETVTLAPSTAAAVEANLKALAGY